MRQMRPHAPAEPLVRFETAVPPRTDRDLYLNASRADKMLAELEYLPEQLPADPQTRDWYRCYKKAYGFDDD